ncbi:MAG: hypothetical protein K0R59_112 [Sphingobacterium sp.]|jgi:hypothetical protein|nr:hypothetical protein [Sphingobacterium sp.]
MQEFIQNQPGEKDARPRYNPQDGNASVSGWAFLVLVAIAVAITYTVLERLKEINKAQTWMYYTSIALVLALGALLGSFFVRKMTRKRINEQKKYYKLFGADWLPQEKREALQLDAPDGYQYGQWIETLEYWPCEVRGAVPTDFRTFAVTTKEERLAGNDQSWGVLSELSYNETIDRLFNGMHSQLFAADKIVMLADARQQMLSRVAALTHLAESYVEDCWACRDDRPPLLLWGFDLNRVIELSRTSFMAGLISEEMAWRNILKASRYAHALFDSLEDFYTNFRMGHAYWCNDFTLTNEKLKGHRSYNESCDWPIKQIGWHINNTTVLPEVMLNACEEFVSFAVRENQHKQ